MTSTILLFLLFAGSLTTSNAWGQEGHAIIANIAYQQLSPTARQTLHTLLPATLTNHTSPYDTPLAPIASWADHVRYTHQYAWTQEWHYVNIHDYQIDGGCPCETHDQACSFHYERDCGNGMCAVAAISQLSRQLQHPLPNLESLPLQQYLRGTDTDHTRIWRRLQEDIPVFPDTFITHHDKLLFIVHFVGDIHQPLHSSRESDRGGNTIHVIFPMEPQFHLNYDWVTSLVVPQAHSRKVNLHAIWDEWIIRRAMAQYHHHSQAEFQRHLEETYVHAKTNTVDSWLECGDGRNVTCTSQWAEESFEAALGFAYENEKGKTIKDGEVLSEEYFQRSLVVVEERLAMAGVRLGRTLEILMRG